MRKINAVILFTVLSHLALAQKNRAHFYGHVYGYGTGPHSARISKMALACTYKKNVFEASGSSFSRLPANIPGNYPVPDGAQWIKWVEEPRNTLSSINLMYGYLLETQLHFVRFVFKGGVLAGQHSYASFNPSSGGTHYDVVHFSSFALGLIVNPTIELSTQSVGISVGTFAILSKERGVGICASMILGDTRNHYDN